MTSNNQPQITPQTEPDIKLKTTTILDRSKAEQLTSFKDEIVLGIVAPVGANLNSFEDQIDRHLPDYGYESNIVRLSDFLKVEGVKAGIPIDYSSLVKRYDSLMSAGNDVRKRTGANDFLVKYAIGRIAATRELDAGNPKPLKGKVHILHSLKHTKEVETLRGVYGAGFFLIGVYCPEAQRLLNLQSNGASYEDAAHLIQRDYDEKEPFGQETSKVFELSDVFIRLDLNNLESTSSQVERFLDLAFGNPFHTPTQDENAMFLAYAASLRSGSLSRQVGVVITSQEGEVIATGTNDVPRYGGGLYWPGNDDQRDFARGYDSNVIQRNRIIDEVVQRIGDFTAQTLINKLKDTGMISDENKAKELYNPESLRQESQEILKGASILDLTEFGRDVHAEMEALLCCARIAVSPEGGTLFSTTFPCHNCAKHIVASGIERVVYVEPYPKSKAKELHSDSLVIEPDSEDKSRVLFEHFVGIGPRRYFDLFSLTLSTGRVLKRKTQEGRRDSWFKQDAYPRVQMSPLSYLEREKRITQSMNKEKKGLASI
jgi:deoxycytidylate deaminase